MEIKTWYSEEDGMGHWYQRLVQLILSVSSWTAKPETLQHSILPRELSFMAGSQQRAMDTVMLCVAAPEVKVPILGAAFGTWTA